jgi:hypothetical protein
MNLWIKDDIVLCIRDLRSVPRWRCGQLDRPMYRYLGRAKNGPPLTHSIVRAPSLFGEAPSLLMKRPVGISTFPLNPLWENSWVKLRDMV